MLESAIRLEVGRQYNRAFNATSEFWGYADDAAYERAVKRADRIETLAENAARRPTEEALNQIRTLADRHVRIIANALRRDGYKFADLDECDTIEII